MSEYRMLNCAVVRPGEKVLVAMPFVRMTGDSATEVKTLLGLEFPGVEFVLIEGAAAFAVYTGDDPASGGSGDAP